MHPVAGSLEAENNEVLQNSASISFSYEMKEFF